MWDEVIPIAKGLGDLFLLSLGHPGRLYKRLVWLFVNLFSARINTFSALFVLSASSLLCNREPAAQEAQPVPQQVMGPDSFALRSGSNS